ncbi:MAG: Adenylate cyclase [Candidatus Rifleibacterium amylolyticum]|nr:MAG: Adenylate cyclase [Candidatus Rifleibacterium amylolyticum]
MHFVASRPIILAVDDSDENLDFISGLLEGKYTVQTARNGEEALAIAQHLPRPELILLDICMPGMNGFEVCQRLKSNPETSLIPVIFLTSLNQPEDEIKGLAGGAVDFITKPFKPAVVKARVGAHIELVRARQRSESLLANILPQKVIDELKNTGISTPQQYDDVSVLFSDMVNFTSLSATIAPKTLLNELTEIFSAFDDILLKNGAQRIKTIGDAYLGVCGMPEVSQDHAIRLARCGLEFIAFLRQRNAGCVHQWEVRIGINSGPVVAGIVGFTKFQYDVFGDTVNLASRVQTASEPMRVCVSDNTLNLLQGQFNVVDRGEVDLKGKGPTKLAYIS